MQYFTIKKGATSQIILINVYDSSSSTGAKLTGLVYNSAGLTAYYYREGAGTGATAITLATATLGTYTSGGFIVVDGTNMPGTYELHLPTGVTATGADRVNIHLKGATNMVPVDIVIDLTDVDLRDSVRAGLTSLPNAAAGAAGGLPTDSTGKTSFNDIAATAIVSSGAITTSGGAVSTVTTTANLTTNNDKTGYSLTATTGLGNQTANITGSLSGSVGSISGITFPTNFADMAITVTTGEVTVGTNNDKTGYTASTVSDKTGYSISGTKTTLDALNDIAATDIVSSGAITTAAGKVSNVGTVDTLTTYTGNTPQTGDAYARLATIAPVKNSAYSNFEFEMVLTSDHVTPATGLTVTGQRSIDGGAFASVSGTIAEVSNGIYQFDALAADTNGTVITWRFSAATADDTFVTFQTVT